MRGGFAIHLDGPPLDLVMPSNPVTQVALCGADYPGMRPLFEVRPGETVKLGQTLFVDRKRPQVRFAAPAPGRLVELRYGPRRALEAAIIAVEGEDAQEFDPNGNVEELLLASGLWTAFLARPFGRIPDPGSRPDRILVAAMDTRPHAPDPMIAIELEPESFRRGIKVLRQLARGPVIITHAPGRRPALADAAEGIRLVQIRGRHPAGLAGTQISLLAPVGRERTCWCISHADVIAIGHLLRHGRLPAERVISVAGPGLENPGLIRVRPGAAIADVLSGELKEEAGKVLSGDAFGGREAAFLGRYHHQITVLGQESGARLGGMAPTLARLLPGSASPAILPMEILQRAMPASIAAVPLLRALAMGDAERARELGCLNLVEEDMALLGSLCPTGADYGKLLRRVLNRLATGVRR